MAMKTSLVCIESKYTVIKRNSDVHSLEMIFPGIPVPEFPGIQRFLMREFFREIFSIPGNFGKILQSLYSQNTKKLCHFMV